MSGEAQGIRSDARAAMLLVHGFNGAPDDMGELQEYAEARGFATRNLLLPGHGTTAREMARATWADWSGAVHEAAAELLESGLPLVLVGHSMGGALSLHEAATNPRIAGVAALCPPLHMHFGQVWATARTHRIVPYLPTI